jgi:carboxynorspermidine decarboxylase
VGLRINPLHREGEVPRYDPARRIRAWASRWTSCSRSISKASRACISTRCASRISSRCAHLGGALPRIAPFLGQLKWLNFGGGHHVTRADYQRDDLVAFLRR